MLLYRSPTKAMAQAQLERALPSTLLHNCQAALLLEKVMAHLAAIDLIQIFEVFDGSRTDHFKVRRTQSLEPVDVSKLGREFLQRYFEVGQELLLEVPGRILEPRLNLLMGVVSHYVKPTDGAVHWWERMRCDPYGTVTMLQGSIELLRQESRRPLFRKSLEEFRAQERTRARDLKAYLKPLTGRALGGSVSQEHLMRLELRLSHERSRVSVEGALSLYQVLQSWFQAAGNAYGVAIAGDIWRTDCDEIGRLYAHVLIAFDGPSPAELSGIKNRLIDNWCAIGGKGAYVCDCKGPYIDLQYRGRNTNERYDSLTNELADSVIYFARTDAPWRFEYPNVPTWGMGDCR